MKFIKKLFNDFLLQIFPASLLTFLGIFYVQTIRFLLIEELKQGLRIIPATYEKISDFLLMPILAYSFYILVPEWVSFYNTIIVGENTDIKNKLNRNMMKKIAYVFLKIILWVGISWVFSECLPYKELMIM